jgi:hypothetical protein
MTIPKRPPMRELTSAADNCLWLKECCDHDHAVAVRAVQAIKDLVGACVKCDVCGEPYGHTRDCIAGQALNDIGVSGWEP